MIQDRPVCCRTVHRSDQGCHSEYACTMGDGSFDERQLQSDPARRRLRQHALTEGDPLLYDSDRSDPDLEDGKPSGSTRRRWSNRSVPVIVFVAFAISFVFGVVVYHQFHPCFIDDDSRNKLSYMVHSFSTVCTELGIPHWIDYGTLLGALRYKGIIPWDHDADVGYDNAFANLLHIGSVGNKMAEERFGIHLNAAIMMYQGMSVDVFGWDRLTNPATGIDYYTRARNRWPLHESFNDFNATWVDKTTLLDFEGRMVSAPQDPIEFIKLRYPHSWDRSMPYKASCYIPWNYFRWKNLSIQ